MFKYRNIPISFILILCLYIQASRCHNYGKGFFNHTGCLYAYMDGGNFEMITADGDLIAEKLELDSLNFDTKKSKCIEENEPGKIVFSFKVDEKSKLKSVAITMKIVPSPSEGVWEVPQANLTISRADVDRKRTFPLEIIDLYASLRHSYSCSQLTMQTLNKKKSDDENDRIEPKAIITIERFQLQPFPELPTTVFSSSFDCAVWIDIPGVMGLILILFIIFVTTIGVMFLQDIQTNDFKFNKEGLLFTQSQMESNKTRQ